jgi:hypothetical protein
MAIVPPVISKTLDSYYAYKFIYLFTQKWEDTPAFKLGIIDATGKELKKRSQLKTDEEKSAYTKLHKLIYALRRVYENVPFTKTTMGRFATAILLIKENTQCKNIDDLFKDFLKEQNIDIPECYSLCESSGNDIYLLNNYWNKDDLLGLSTMKEETSTAGIDITDAPPKKKYVPETETFSGATVFSCDPDTFQACTHGKRKFARYSTFVGSDDLGQAIREYGLKNPKSSIILKNSLTGGMIYLRRGQ